jgi:hypothetical protein
MLVSRRVFSGVSCPSAGRQQLVHRCQQVQQKSMSLVVRASAQTGSQQSSEDRWDTVSEACVGMLLACVVAS